ncbi:MAG: peptidoglycan DD-metalloendopeptidase family protein [Patescibacteria group bacterium]|nr:peptidoglycan DD-metalloendopeptidase family protein [Patescibacteria group bacterium]
MEKVIKIIAFILITGFLLNPSVFVLGEQSSEQPDPANENALVINQEIKDINTDIDDKKNDIKKMQEKQEKYSDAIGQKQSEKASLNNQLAILDNRLAKAELDIDLVETDIERIILEKQKTDIEIKTKNKEIANEIGDISNILNLLHKKNSVNSLEIMLLNSSLSDFLIEIRYLEDINKTIGDKLGELKKLKKSQENEREILDKQNKELEELKVELSKKQRGLINEQETKVVILSQVNQSERQYQRLLEQAKKEQGEAAAEIVSLEKLVRAKLTELEGGDLEFNDNGMAWPVPRNVVTAYFHDPDYPFRYIFEHPGIDIRAGQGTTLKAAASGYVARTKNGGVSGYSYIMLIHGDGLSTVYGHVSKILVSEDDYVVQGQTIGLTGGIPGTPGAGKLTTGPHLHFEVRLNGIPVDPLSYLR